MNLLCDPLAPVQREYSPTYCPQGVALQGKELDGHHGLQGRLRQRQVRFGQNDPCD